MYPVKETDTHKLWRNIEPHLKKAMQTVYLREVSRSVPFTSVKPLMNHVTVGSAVVSSHHCVSSLFPVQSSVGADAANGGEGGWSLERYQHTLSAVALSDVIRLQSRC